MHDVHDALKSVPMIDNFVENWKNEKFKFQ
jgi:hypothetical protein